MINCNMPSFSEAGSVKTGQRRVVSYRGFSDN